MCSLKIHDNVPLSRVSIECEHVVFTLAKLDQSTKYMLKFEKEMLAKLENSKFRLEQQITRTTSTLFWCLTSYKLTHFLVFVVAKIWFFRREEKYLFWTTLAFAQSEICLKLLVKTLEPSQLTPSRYLLALIRLISQFSQENTCVRASF